MSIYTKTGDNGTTALFGGKRVLKCEELVDVYGSIDELNSWIGYLIADITEDHLKKLLTEVQTDLFLIGGFLAGWDTQLSSLETRVPQMEVEIDTMEKILPPLSNFIIPGGTKLASSVHITRSICRRVERQVVRMVTQKSKDISDPNHKQIIQYLNRLSDLFFMFARYINNQANVGEVVWYGNPRPKKSIE